MGRRRAVVAVIAVVFIAAGLAVTLGDLRPVDGLQGLWHISQMYDTNSNESYSVIFHSVNFTFICRRWVPMDVPIPVYFIVAFSDGSFELMNNTIGGLAVQPPRVVHSTHSSPSAAIISSPSLDYWYDWYYAVSA